MDITLADFWGYRSFNYKTRNKEKGISCCIINSDKGMKAFNEIKNQSNFPNRVFVLEEQYGSDIQQSIISNASFLIGARYHSIIFSINQDVSFISLSYEHKMNGVVEILNKKDCEIDLVKEFADQPMSDILQSDLIERIITKSHVLESIKGTKKVAHNIANNGFEELKTFINAI